MNKLSKVVGVAGAAATAAYLSKKENRERVKSEINKAKQDPKNYYNDVSEKAKEQMDRVQRKINPKYKKNLGKPLNLEDSDMVEEGALTSVQYYNKLQEEDKES